MSEKKTIDGRTCVRTCVHGQDCYVLPVVPPYDRRTEYHPKSYKVYAKVRDEHNQRVGKVVEREYPVTPEAVKSFRDIADYHTDPAAAVASAPSRKNLGDIRDMQSIAKMDDTQLNAMAERFASARVEIERIRAERANASVEQSEEVTENG